MATSEVRAVPRWGPSRVRLEAHDLCPHDHPLQDALGLGSWALEKGRDTVKVWPAAMVMLNIAPSPGTDLNDAM